MVDKFIPHLKDWAAHLPDLKRRDDNRLAQETMDEKLSWSKESPYKVDVPKMKSALERQESGSHYKDETIRLESLLKTGEWQDLAEAMTKFDKQVMEDMEDKVIHAPLLSSRRIEESALDVQVGGEHYRNCKIQPIEFIHANKLDFIQGCVVKYITRAQNKGGKEDVLKVVHYARLLLELEYGVKSTFEVNE